MKLWFRPQSSRSAVLLCGRKLAQFLAHRAMLIQGSDFHLQTQQSASVSSGHSLPRKIPQVYPRYSKTVQRVTFHLQSRLRATLSPMANPRPRHSAVNCRMTGRPFSAEEDTVQIRARIRVQSSLGGGSMSPSRIT